MFGKGSSDEPKPFLEHLEDLRMTIIRSFAVMVPGMVLAGYFAPQILNLLKIPLVRAGKDPEKFLQIVQVAGGMSVLLRVAFWGGLLLAAPLVLYFVAGFIFPGLHSHEKKAIVGSSGAALALFCGGVFMGFSFTHVAIKVFLGVSEWMGSPVEWVYLTDYVSFVLKLLLGFGVAFELPVVLYMLGSLGLVSSRSLRHYRRHAIVIILIVAMVLTPPDVFTQLLMGLPMIVLYEITIWLVWFKERSRPDYLAPVE